MLIDTEEVYIKDPFLNKLLTLISFNNSSKPIRLTQGIYLIGHFGSSNFMPGFDDFCVLENGFSCYGVCDNWAQVLQACPELITSVKKFVVTLTPVLKEDQPPDGGWRWHTWGPYIGTHTPQCEYLYDEKDIDRVYVYHVYEKTED